MKNSIFLLSLIIGLFFVSCKKPEEEAAIRPPVNDKVETSTDLVNERPVPRLGPSDLNAHWAELFPDMREYDPELMNDYLGTWFLLNEEEKIDASKSCLTIFTEGESHRFTFDYYSSKSMGKVIITQEGNIELLVDDWFIPYSIIGPPFELNDKKTILLAHEWPLGFFQQE